MFKKSFIGIFVALSVQMSGCVMSSEEQTITQKPTFKKVSIQLCGAKEWSGTVVTDSFTSYVKPEYDTTAFDLGEFKVGTKFTMKTGIGKVEFFTPPDSIRVIMGNDTTITYYPEGLEKVYTVE